MAGQRHIVVRKEASTVERCWLTVRGQTILNIPLESALSFPIPKLTDTNETCLTGFYYRVQFNGRQEKILIKPPFARILASYPDGNLINCYQESAPTLFPEIKVHDDLATLPARDHSPARLVQYRRDLYQLMTKLIPMFIGQEQLSQKVVDDFLFIFDIVSERPFLPYYHALNPQFFSWLGVSRR